jgi:hypothetical protein
MSSKLSSLLPDLEKSLKEIEGMAPRTVAHRRKFQYFVSMFLSYFKALSKEADNIPLKQIQVDAYKQIEIIIQEFVE